MVTIADIKRTNSEHGFHFFDPDSMRFFSSYVGRKVYDGEGGTYFVTSEQFLSSWSDDKQPRYYTVRHFNPETGNVATVGEFNKLSRHQAHKLAGELAQGVVKGSG